MNGRPFVHAAVQADRQVAQRGSTYHGGALKSSAGGNATVDVYDGLDANGDLIDAFQCAASSRDVHVFEAGLVIRIGLYVDLGSNVNAFTTYYDPVPREMG